MTPSTTGTAHWRRIDMSTMPWAWWALKERMEVGTMTASEVPTHSGILHLLGHADHAEELVEHRHHDGAAADAENARQEARDRAGGEQPGGEQGEIEGSDAEHRGDLGRKRGSLCGKGLIWSTSRAASDSGRRPLISTRQAWTL